ncbi:hypothetical protein [Roseovarius sp. M141]|uniref:hypothetical protein n=1 Tax=Roseovarius sp. M141 TaxID=2583806 RepID=UPI0020CE2B3E|nr:hypothetical protein [Roseovarius sp. M141]MCQ0090543.1 hypothetical protein [Roseovarius sp. M141]
MARVFLHVGGHKTGTSYLQAMFHANAALLARHGIHYPDIGPNNAHHALAAPWISTPDIPDAFFGPAGRKGLWDRLIAQYADMPGTVFLSAENFTRVRPQRVDMAQLAARLRAFGEVRVVYTMRQQVELLQSLWMQVAKTRPAPNLRKYVKAGLSDRRGGGVPIDHSNVYTALLEGFRPEEIRLVDYASMKNSEGGIVGTFLRLMDSDLKADALAPLKSQENANISPDPIEFFVATEIMNREAPPPGDLIETIRCAIRPGDAPAATLLSRSEHSKLRRRFVNSNNSLVERVQPVQPGFVFDPGSVPPDLFFRDDLTTAHWTRVAAALYSRNVTATSAPRPLIRRILDRYQGVSGSS